MTNTVDTITYTIYGASDDLVEVETSDRSFTEEYYIGLDGKRLRLHSPSGAIVDVHLDFGAYEWEITVTASANTQELERWLWPITFGWRPDSLEDPAIHIEAPVGTQVLEND